MRAAVRGHPGADARIAGKIRRLTGRYTGLLRTRVHSSQLALGHGGRTRQPHPATVVSAGPAVARTRPSHPAVHRARSEEHTSELQSLMRISYAVFCLKKKNKTQKNHT